MNYQPYGNQEFYNPPPPQPPARTNGKSIVALVLGILSIVTPWIGLIFGIVAIIFAAISFKEIRQRYEQGRGLAIAGLVCGIIGTLIYAILILFFVIVIIAFNDVDSFNYYNSFNNI